jgi:hypothetical protein
MEVGTMMKKVMVAVVALMFAAMLAAPSKANAQVVFRVGVGPVVVGNAPVLVAPPPVVVAPAPYVAYGPGYVYPPAVYPGMSWLALATRDRTPTDMAGGVDTDGGVNASQHYSGAPQLD